MAKSKAAQHLPPHIPHLHQRPSLDLWPLTATILNSAFTAHGKPPFSADCFRHFAARAQGAAHHVDAVCCDGPCFVETYDLKLPRRIDARRTGAVYAE